MVGFSLRVSEVAALKRERLDSAEGYLHRGNHGSGLLSEGFLMGTILELPKEKEGRFL
jgi:hypothetical protein